MTQNNVQLDEAAIEVMRSFYAKLNSPQLRSNHSDKTNFGPVAELFHESGTYRCAGERVSGKADISEYLKENQKYWTRAKLTNSTIPVAGVDMSVAYSIFELCKGGSRVLTGIDYAFITKGKIIYLERFVGEEALLNARHQISHPISPGIIQLFPGNYRAIVRSDGKTRKVTISDGKAANTFVAYDRGADLLRQT
jgi:hypothetical protein